MGPRPTARTGEDRDWKTPGPDSQIPWNEPFRSDFQNFHLLFTLFLLYFCHDHLLPLTLFHLRVSLPLPPTPPPASAQFLFS